jgi:hypothetical protein
MLAPLVYIANEETKNGRSYLSQFCNIISTVAKEIHDEIIFQLFSFELKIF